MGRRYFSAEFKTEAVRQVVELRRPKAQVARDLGVHVNVLKSWLNAYAKDPVGSRRSNAPRSPGCRRSSSASGRSATS
jgi:transposase-like protein